MAFSTGQVAFVMMAIGAIATLVGIARLITYFDHAPAEQGISRSLRQLAKRFGGKTFQNSSTPFAEVVFSSDGVPFSVVVRRGQTGDARFVVRVSAPWKEHPGFRLKIVRETYATATQDMLKALDAKTGDESFDRKFYLRTNDESKMNELLSVSNRMLVENLFRVGCVDIYINNNEIFAERKIQASHISQVFVQKFVELCLMLRNGTEDHIHFVSQVETSGKLTVAAVCQVCGDCMETQLVSCLSCKTLHHRECWEFVGFCSTYACGEKMYQGL